jgi:hypothetical protein
MKLETYTVTFSYSEPHYTSVILPAKDEEEVTDMVKEMTKGLGDVKIIQIVNIKDAPGISNIYDQQVQSPKGTLN